MVNTLYTIGYSGFSTGDLIETLKKHKISLLVDVRSNPYSKYYPEYNKDTLENCLKRFGIYYRNYATEFGARQENKNYYCNEGYLDFDKFAKSELFLHGVDKLCKSMEKGFIFALMCAEKDPICCHRTILISRAFYERGYNVVHLLDDGTTKSQEDINLCLINKYYPDHDQFTMFEEMQDTDTLLKLAYRKQNAEIGYRMEDA